MPQNVFIDFSISILQYEKETVGKVNWLTLQDLVVEGHGELKYVQLRER